jgi:hypothetical protein
MLPHRNVFQPSFRGNGLSVHLGLQKWQDQDPREVVRELGRLVVRLSNDKVPNIFQASLQLLRALLSVNVHGAHQRDIGQLMTDIVPILVDKVRVRDSHVLIVVTLVLHEGVHA